LPFLEFFSCCPSLLHVSFLHFFCFFPLFLFTAASFFFTSFLFGEYLSKLLTFSSFLCKTVHFVIGLSVGDVQPPGWTDLLWALQVRCNWIQHRLEYCGF
jgi:uncharacterized membrane protein